MALERPLSKPEVATDKHLSHHDTIGLNEVVEIGGDLLLLPTTHALPVEEARALRTAGVIPPEDSSLVSAAEQIYDLQSRYDYERSTSHTEPEWIRDVPISVQTHLRQKYALTEEDALAIIGKFPYTGLWYMVRDGGLCEDVCRSFNVWRLEHIKQLGFLQAPIYNSTFARQSLSETSRYLHSLDVMTIATVIGHRLDLPEHEMNVVRTVALTHDVGTPAGGDSVKLVDPVGLDEDKNYPEIVDALDLRKLYERFDIDPIELKELVSTQQGVLGNILDIADKIAYVARDLHSCLHHIEGGAHETDQLGLKTILNLVEQYPYVCSLWDSVEIKDGKVCFKDISRLVAFLKVRVLLFRELYYHPTARFGEFLMSRLLVKALYAKGILTREKLITMDDGGLMRVLSEEYGVRNALDTVSSDLARCEAFPSMEKAEEFMAKLRREGNLFAMLDDNRRSIKTGADLLVSTPEGAKPLSEVAPGSARELEEMASLLPLVHVYYLEGDPALPREKLAKLKADLEGLN